MRSIKAIIFDMDGVLVDTEPLFMNKVFEFYQKHKKNISYNEITKLTGSPSTISSKLMTNWFGENMTESEFLKFYESNTEKLRFNYDDIVNPYIRIVLPRLKNEGYKLAIASSFPMEYIERFIKDCNLNGIFDLLVTGQEFTESKPNPDIYCFTAKELGVNVQQCIVVEDSTYGIEAGKRAGMYVMAHHDVRFGFNQSRADEIFYDFLEFFKKIKERA